MIRLFQDSGIPTTSGFDLARTKKQLTAEFSFAKTGFIEVGKYSYTRQDVFEEMDRPDFYPERFNFHLTIWNSPSLLKLLEENEADFPGLKNDFTPLFGNNQFDVFFSPYFAGPFNYVSRNLINSASFHGLSNLLLYEDFLQPEEREEAFRPIRLFLDENLRTLRNVNKENYGILRPKIQHWINGSWSGFFNNLPPEFYEIKNDFIVLLINIGVAIQKVNREDCRLISHQLMALQETPEHLRSVVVSNHAVYLDKKSPNYMNIIWIALIVIKLIALGSC